MTKKKHLKRKVRQRQLKTGESYTTALTRVLERKMKSSGLLKQRHPGRVVVRSGLDVLAGSDFRPLKGLRIGLICNPTSVDSELRHAADLLAGAPEVHLAALFGPEHGVRGDTPYLAPVGDDHDPSTRVPTFSLYGKDRDSLHPTPERLADLDALVFDIQDVGSRYYTYLATMMLCLEAAAKARLRFFVLDRPNPIGGTAVEGPALHRGFESFCGLHDLAPRHGMTAGEVCRLFRAERKLDVELEVVCCEGWQREMYFAETRLPWVTPSPNMPTADTAVVYPGMCLLEGTNLSEGRGTSKPFEAWGAPWLDAEQLVASLEAEQLPGVRFRPVSFQPTADKHAGKRCHGAALHITDREAFQPFQTGLLCVAHARAAAPEEFSWRTEAYEFVEGIPAFDLLTGSARVRTAIERGDSVASIVASFRQEERAFAARRTPHLLYQSAGAT